MLVRQQAESIAHTVELLNFLKDRLRMHEDTAFLTTKPLRGENFRLADLFMFREPERGFAGLSPESNVLPKCPK